MLAEIEKDTSHKDWRLLWFSRLDSAINRKKPDEIHRAIRNLARLGIEVRFTLPPVSAEHAEAAHV